MGGGKHKPSVQRHNTPTSMSLSRQSGERRAEVEIKSTPPPPPACVAPQLSDSALGPKAGEPNRRIHTPHTHGTGPPSAARAHPFVPHGIPNAAPYAQKPLRCMQRKAERRLCIHEPPPPPNAREAITYDNHRPKPSGTSAMTLAVVVPPGLCSIWRLWPVGDVRKLPGFKQHLELRQWLE